MSEVILYQFDKITKFIDYRGKTPKKTESGIPLITAKNIKFGYLSEEPKEFIAENDYEDWMTRGIPNKGDILFTTEAPLGNVCILNTNQRRAFAQRAIIFQPLDIKVYISKYLFYYLMSPIFLNELDLKKTGTTVKGMKSSILKKFQIPLPSLSEQERIVSKLDTLFEKIDKTIALHQNNMDEADMFMGSVLNEMFGELEGKYSATTLSTLSTFKNGFAFKSKEFNNEGNGLRVIRIGNVLNINKNPVYIDEKKEFEKYLLRENDIVISMTGTRKKKDYLFVRVVDSNDSYLNQRVGKISNKENSNYKYLYYYLQSNYFRDKIFDYETGTVNQGNISGKDIINSKIPNISLEYQEKVIKYLDKVSKKTEKIKSVQKEEMASLKALKASILDKAFRGEL